MIHISLRMPNWIGARGDFVTGALRWFSFCRSGKIGKHKAWEVQTDYWGWGRLFELEVDLDWSGSDHAGPRFSLTLLGFMVAAQIYDTRHWDEDKNCFVVYDDAFFKKEQREREEEEADALLDAYRKVAEDIDRKAQIERNAFLETPEGKAEVAAELARLKEEKRKRGEAYRAANLAKKGE